MIKIDENYRKNIFSNLRYHYLFSVCHFEKCWMDFYQTVNQYILTWIATKHFWAIFCCRSFLLSLSSSACNMHYPTLDNHFKDRFHTSQFSMLLMLVLRNSFFSFSALYENSFFLLFFAIEYTCSISMQ